MKIRAVTYVLVHGGGTTGRFWDRLLPHLDQPALAVHLPGRADRPADLGSITVGQEVASVVADIESSTQSSFTLVAHSSGGLVVPGVVAALGDRVERVVLSAGLIPPEDGCGLDCMQPRHAEGLKLANDAAQQEGNPIIFPAPTEPEAMRKSFGGDPLDDETLAYVFDPVRSVADTVNHYFQPVHWSTAASVDVTYLLNARDRPIPTALQVEMVARLPQRATRIDLDGGHIPAVTDPGRFAALLASRP